MPTPFERAAPQAADTLINRMFGPPVPIQGQQMRFAQEEETRTQESAARQLVLSKVNELRAQNLPPNQIIGQLLNSPEFAEALASTPDMKSFMTEIVQSIQTPEPSRAAPGSTAVDAGGKPIAGTRVADKPAKPQAVPAEILVVDAILKAEAAGQDDRAKLLRKSLPVDKSGDVTAAVALKMRAAGVKDTGNRTINSVSTKDAQAAIKLGQKETAPASITLNDLLIRASGGKTGKTESDNISKTIAAAALELRKETLGAENFMALLFQGIVGGVGGGSAATVPIAGALGQHPGIDKMSEPEVRQLVEDAVAGRKTITDAEKEQLEKRLREFDKTK